MICDLTMNEIDAVFGSKSSFGQDLLNNWAEYGTEGAVEGGVAGGVSGAVIGGPGGAVGGGLIGLGAGYIAGSVYGFGKTIYAHYVAP